MISMDNQTAVVTVVGKDTIGIIARVSAELAHCQVNIKDITQTIMEDIFTMIMIVDLSKSTFDIKQLGDHLDEVGKDLGVSILIQHTNLFNAMHRI